MFQRNEIHTTSSHAGSLEVICGPMFSSKTEELLRRLRRAKIAGLTIAIFKPAVDERYSKTRIVSHDANYFPSLPVSSSQEILQHTGKGSLIALDEAQFFDEALPGIVEHLIEQGIRVIAAGLDMDYTGKPFGSMPALMAMADNVMKLNAICVCCGEYAIHSFRYGDIENLVQIGEKEIYEPRCRPCFLSGRQAIR